MIKTQQLHNTQTYIIIYICNYPRSYTHILHATVFAISGSKALVQHQRILRRALHLRDALEKRDPWCEESSVRD